MTDVNAIIKKIKEQMDKLKDIDNKDVKEVYSKVNSFISEISPVEEKKKEDKPKEEKSEDKKEVEEEKKSESEPKSEDKVEEIEKEKDKIEEKELNMNVSKKLSEAAIELEKNELDIKTKDEIIIAFKSQITELSTELKKYKDAEALELQKDIDEKLMVKVNSLIELYKDLGITKDAETIKSNFDEKQIDNLIIDLSEVSPQKLVTSSPKRQTAVSLELGKVSQSKKENKLSDSDIVDTLFGM